MRFCALIDEPPLSQTSTHFKERIKGNIVEQGGAAKEIEGNG